MWNKSLRLLMVRVKVTKRRGFSFPVPIWVVGEFMDALTDLAGLGRRSYHMSRYPKTKKLGNSSTGSELGRQVD